jgi:hypothetical protein
MRVFLSCVSSEFRSCRLKLASQLGALKGQPYEVNVQEDFKQGGFTLLDKLAQLRVRVRSRHSSGLRRLRGAADG